MPPKNKRSLKRKRNYSQRRRSSKEPEGHLEPDSNSEESAETSGSEIKSMKRGIKRKKISTEETIQVPSSAVLPARLLSTESQWIPQTTLPVIKKEDHSLPVIKREKSDSTQLDSVKTFDNTDVDDTEKNTTGIQNLTSEFPAVSEAIPQTTDDVNIGTNNELSFSHGSFNLQNVKSEPLSPVACTANPTFNNSNCCEQNAENINLTKIKCEPRSRSSSTETVLNEESRQLPLAECQVDTSTKSSSAIYEETNVAHTFPGAGENSVLSLKKETVHPSFVASMHSPNISVSQHRNSAMQTLTSNMTSVTKLFKYNNFNIEIAKADAKDCLNYLNVSYPSNRSFSLFFSDDTFLRQQENPAVEPTESIPISSTPALTEVISTDALRKIIEIASNLPTSSSPNLPLSLQSNSENNINVKNINALSVSGSISHLPIISSTTGKESDHTFNPNIRIKEEPLDDYDASSITSPPSVSHRMSTRDKRSAEETTPEMHTLTKKIKMSPDHSLSATGYSIDTQIKPDNDTEKCDSTDTSKGSIQNQPLENARIISNTLKSWVSTPSNSCSDKNTVFDTENTPIYSSNSIPCIGQSGEDKNLTMPSKVLFNPKICETKPLDDCKTLNVSTIFQKSLMARRRSTEVAVSDIQEVTKINTLADLQGHSVASATDDRVATSKVTNMLENPANMSHIFSVSDSKNSKATDSIVSKSTTSKFTTSYLHLLPEDILKDVSCTDKVPDTSPRMILPVEPSTSVSSDFTVVTTVSDSVITKNNINYSQNTPVINMFSTYSAMQHVKKTNLGDDKNPNDINNSFACNKINTVNCSEPGVSSNRVTTKKKISPEIYFQRKSSLYFHDPCTEKNGQNTESQISSPDNSVAKIIASNASLTKQQNPNRTSIAYNQNAHQYTKSTSAPKFEITSNVQQKSFQNSVSSQSISMTTPTETPQRSITSTRVQTQVTAENSKVSHFSSQRSGNVIPSTSRDSRKTYYQKLFGSCRQDISSFLRRDTAGNRFIETKDLPYIILSWNVGWLSIQKEALMCPPIWDNYHKVKDTYECIQDYYDTYQPLHLLNIWFDIYQGWEKSKVLYSGRLNEVKREEEFVNMSCTLMLNADRSNCLKKDDILICTTSTQQLFGRIVDLEKCDWNPAPDPFHLQKPGVMKQLHLKITCAESITVQPPDKLYLQNLTNIGIALKKNDALKYINPAMQAMVLNPSENERLLQTTTVPPITNVSCMMDSVRSLQHRVTIMNTSTASISTSTILRVAFLLKTDSILLVCVKDEEAFLDLALKMKSLNMVLAVREDEVPPQLRGLTVKYCDSTTLKSCNICLTHMRSMFFGELDSRLKTESVICLIHEAQCFFETETTLLLAYKVEHLILTGRPEVKASTSPMLVRFSFDVSLFHRILGNRSEVEASNNKKCVFCGLKSARSSGVSFHRFPKDTERSDKWARKAGLKYILNTSPAARYKNFRVCSRHFDDSDYMNRENKGRLLPSAVPSGIENSTNVDVSLLKKSLQDILNRKSSMNDSTTFKFGED